MAHVVANKQGRARRRYIALARYVQSIKRVPEYPERQADEKEIMGDDDQTHQCKADEGNDPPGVPSQQHSRKVNYLG